MNFRTDLKDEFEMSSVPSKTFLTYRFNIFFVNGLIVYKVHLYYLAFCDIWPICVLWIIYQNLYMNIYIYIYIYILGWSAVDQSLLGKHQQGAFRRIWKTFSTVPINQRRLVCMITWHCKSIHYPDKFLQRVVFSLKI